MPWNTSSDGFPTKDRTGVEDRSILHPSVLFLRQKKFVSIKDGDVFPTQRTSASNYIMLDPERNPSSSAAKINLLRHPEDIKLMRHAT